MVKEFWKSVNIWQSHERIFLEKLTNWFSWTKSWQWTLTFCQKATKFLTCFCAAVNRTILVLPEVIAKLRKLCGSFAAYALLCSIHVPRTRAFFHCVSNVTMVLWHKVNLANNHSTFQDKMDVILWKSFTFKWHYTALCVSVLFTVKFLTFLIVCLYLYLIL